MIAAYRDGSLRATVTLAVAPRPGLSAEETFVLAFLQVLADRLAASPAATGAPPLRRAAPTLGQSPRPPADPA